MSRLRELRIASGYTGVEIAKRVGISKSYYFQIEYGQKRLYYDLAIRIAKIFNKKPDAVFYDDLNKF